MPQVEVDSLELTQRYLTDKLKEFVQLESEVEDDTQTVQENENKFKNFREVQIPAVCEQRDKLEK